MPFNFSIKDIIKIEGKTFDDLTVFEVAKMIDADSSLTNEGNEYFSSSALDEFLHNYEPERDDLKRVQKKILENIYVSNEGGIEKEINKEFLISFSKQLKLENFMI